jgi:hypothetical protein
VSSSTTIDPESSRFNQLMGKFNPTKYSPLYFSNCHIAKKKEIKDIP